MGLVNLVQNYDLWFGHAILRQGNGILPMMGGTLM